MRSLRPYLASPGVAIHQVPHHFRFNEHIKTGYRPVMPPHGVVVHFLTSVSNETMNVLTHLAPLLVLLATLFDASWLGLPRHYSLVRFYVACASCTMLGSVVYHLFMAACGTQASYEALLFADVLGIWLLGTALSVLIVLHGFLGVPLWLKMGVLVVVMGGCVVQLWRARSARERALSLSIQALFRLALNLARLCLGPGTPGQWYLPSVSHGAAVMVLAELAMVAVGLVNVKRFPERALGAKLPWLDTIGNSHQLMHVVSAYCIYLGYRACLLDCSGIDGNPWLLDLADAQVGALTGWLPALWW
jgi:hypothetical protein